MGLFSSLPSLPASEIRLSAGRELQGKLITAKECEGPWLTLVAADSAKRSDTEKTPTHGLLVWKPHESSFHSAPRWAPSKKAASIRSLFGWMRQSGAKCPPNSHSLSECAGIRLSGWGSRWRSVTCSVPPVETLTRTICSCLILTISKALSATEPLFCHGTHVP